LARLIGLVNELRDRGCGFRSLTESIDTATAGGELVFHLFRAMAQFERALVSPGSMKRSAMPLAAARSVKSCEDADFHDVPPCQSPNRAYSVAKRVASAPSQ
jgi:hypothetical protein